MQWMNELNIFLAPLGGLLLASLDYAREQTADTIQRRIMFLITSCASLAILCEVVSRAHAEVQSAYADYEFHRVFHALHNLCVTDLSAFYLDVLKDRLYASAPTGKERRSAQTALLHSHQPQAIHRQFAEEHHDAHPCRKPTQPAKRDHGR